MNLPNFCLRAAGLYRVALVLSAALLVSGTGLRADYFPDQADNTAEVHMESDNCWHINSTYYCRIRVLYHVSHLASDASVDEKHWMILERKEDFSTGIECRDRYYSVDIVKITFPSSTDTNDSDPSKDRGAQDPTPDDETPPPRIGLPTLQKQLTFKRSQTSGGTAFGSVFVDGKFICYFMETPKGQTLIGKGTYPTTFQILGNSATMTAGNSTEQIQFSTGLTRDSDGNFTGINSDGQGEACGKLANEMGSSAVEANAEITDFGSPSSFEQ